MRTVTPGQASSASPAAKQKSRAVARAIAGRHAKDGHARNPRQVEPSREELQAWFGQSRLFNDPPHAFGPTRADFEQAWSRVGKTDEARARWLIDFAARDLSRLSSADWLDLRWHVLGFLYPPSGGPPPFSSADIPGEPSCSEAQVRNMHRWLRSGLDRLGQGHPWNIHIATSPCLIVHGRGLVTWPDMDLQGELNDYSKSFKLRAYETLGRQAKRFRICARCRQPFIARKRQAYCTKKCSQSVRTRKYRAGHRDKVNALRMKAYYANRGKARRSNAQEVERAESPTMNDVQLALQEGQDE